MPNRDASTSTSAACWFCSRGEGGENSIALPFWSNTSDEVRVLVLPRCDACHTFHHRQKFPSALLIIACTAPPMLLVKLLPMPDGVRSVLMVIAMLAGFAGGIVLVANREARQARARGTRPLHDYVQHPPYHALAADTQAWRQARGVGVGDGETSSIRRETVGDYRHHFTHVSNDLKALAALERGCVEAGVPFETVH